MMQLQDCVCVAEKVKELNNLRFFFLKKSQLGTHYFPFNVALARIHSMYGNAVIVISTSLFNILLDCNVEWSENYLFFGFISYQYSFLLIRAFIHL